MAQVVWSDAAERDLREIHDFIARDSPRYAAIVIRRLREAVSRLMLFPESDRRVPESQLRMHRELTVQPYRVICRYDREADRVMVVRVVHGRRLLPALNGAG